MAEEKKYNVDLYNKVADSYEHQVEVSATLKVMNDAKDLLDGVGIKDYYIEYALPKEMNARVAEWADLRCEMNFEPDEKPILEPRLIPIEVSANLKSGGCIFINLENKLLRHDWEGKEEGKMQEKLKILAEKYGFEYMQEEDYEERNHDGYDDVDSDGYVVTGGEGRRGPPEAF